MTRKDKVDILTKVASLGCNWYVLKSFDKLEETELVGRKTFPSDMGTEISTVVPNEFLYIFGIQQ